MLQYMLSAILLLVGTGLQRLIYRFRHDVKKSIFCPNLVKTTECEKTEGGVLSLDIFIITVFIVLTYMVHFLNDYDKIN